MHRLILTREFITSFLKESIPEYEEMLASIEKNGSWIKPSPKVTEYLVKLNVHDYPVLYRGENTLATALLLAFMPADKINALNAEIENLPDNEKAAQVEELISCLTEATDEIVDNFPDTQGKQEAAQKSFNKLSSDEQAKAVKQGRLFIASFFASFHNTISMMVHGHSLIDLVRAAEAGDNDAFFQAVHIDSRILSVLPYFKERHEKAILHGDTDFQDKLHYRLTSPLLKGRIRFKTLWLTFAILDESGLLDGSLKHREILDICEEAGVGGYENRIEDVGYLSKRLDEYREYQNISKRSRH